MDEDNLTEIAQRELAQQVEMAFSDVPYPGDDNIVTHPNTSLASHLPALLTGKHWKDVPLEFIIQENLSLPLFTPAGFRFYLPAFLRATLLYPDQVDILPSNIFSSLTPPDEEINLQNFLNRVNGFTREQTETLKAFVRLYIVIEHSYSDDRHDKASHFWEQR